MSEESLFYLVLALAVISSLVFTLRWRRSYGLKHFVISSTFSAMLFGAAILWWFAVASDGFSQVFGSFVYGAGFVVSTVINIFITYRRKKAL